MLYSMDHFKILVESVTYYSMDRFNQRENVEGAVIEFNMAD